MWGTNKPLFPPPELKFTLLLKCIGMKQTYCGNEMPSKMNLESALVN